MDKKEYIERGALIDFLKQEIEQCENDLAESCGDDRYEQAVDSRMTAFLEVLRRAESKPAADVVSRGVFEQVKWERDMAMQQLEEHGIPFGGEADDVVNVVRCKDCKYFKHFKGCGNWCHRRIRTDIEFHTKTNDFCSWGKRKDKDDGR